MTKSELRVILNKNENSHLDFKAQYPQNRVDLVHDILSMANVTGNDPRYLIYGVADDKKILGIGHQQKKKLNDLVDLLKGAKINSVPQIELFNSKVPKNRTVQILKIENNSEHKPYWTLSDYTLQGRTVRAGVIYSRIADRNTAISNESTSEKIVEQLFKERFGLDKSPIERLKIYLRDTESWRFSNDYEDHYYFYEPFPEFTIKRIHPEIEKLEKNDKWISRPWIMQFPTHYYRKYLYDIRYHQTTLDKYSEITCDDGVYHCLEPHMCAVWVGDEEYQVCYYDESEIQYATHLMIKRANSPLKNRGEHFEIPVFKSMGDAFQKLRTKKYLQKKYPYYCSQKNHDWLYYYKGKMKLLTYKNEL